MKTIDQTRLNDILEMNPHETVAILGQLKDQRVEIPKECQPRVDEFYRNTIREAEEGHLYEFAAMIALQAGFDDEAERLFDRKEAYMSKPEGLGKVARHMYDRVFAMYH